MGLMARALASAQQTKGSLLQRALDLRQKAGLPLTSDDESAEKKKSLALR